MDGAVDIEAELSGEMAPRRVPTTYPGWWPAESFLLTGDDALGLMYLRPPTFGFEVVDWDGDDASPFRAGHLELYSAESGRQVMSLAEYLRAHGLDSMENRVPVLAVGSNAAPAQLAYKFNRAGVSPAIPSLRVTLNGFGVGFVPAVTQFGYIPATLIADPALTATMFLQFLDRNQLDVMDASEGVNRTAGRGESATGYERIEINTPIHLPHGEVLQKAYAYVGRLGVLSINNSPVLSDNNRFGVEVDDATPSRIHSDAEGFLAVASQAELLQVLTATDRTLGTEFSKALGHSTRKGDQFTKALERANSLLLPYRTPNPLVGLQPGPLFRYRDLDPVTTGQLAEAPATSFRVMPTGDDTERGGESVALVNPADYLALGKPAQVAVSSRSLQSFLIRHNHESLRAPRAIARLVSSDKVAPGTVHLDEILRIACGVHIQEAVEIVPLTRARSRIRKLFDRIVDRIIGKPNFVTCRAVLASVTTMEREVALATPLTMQMLGIDAGDFAILEGVGPSPAEENTSSPALKKIRTASVRVFPLDDDTLADRRQSQGGGWLSATPRAQTALGISSDLPPLFIDSAMRTRLFGAQHGQRVGVVRLRVSRIEQVSKEGRELALVVLFSLLAWVITANEGDVLSGPERVWILAGGFVLYIALLLRRISWRYRHSRRRRPLK